MRDQGFEDQLRSLMQAFGRAEGSAVKPRRTRLALVRAEALGNGTTIASTHTLAAIS